MSEILPPTTSRDLSASDLSPCCDVALELVSPPSRYECRDCMAVYDLADDADGDSSSGGGDTTSEEETPTCAGMDGECTRSVDEHGDRCWQHQTE